MHGALPARSSAALRPAASADALRPGLARYKLDLHIDAAQGLLTGSQLITFTNTTTDTLADLMLRLYPNFPPDVLGTGRNTAMSISNVRAAGSSVTPRLEAQTTAARIPLPRPLAPGAAITLSLQFEATFEPWEGTDIVLLTSYYPMLAVYEGDGWRTDVTRFPDKVFAETALYESAVHLDEGWDVLATGRRLAQERGSAEGITHQFISGPVREWALAFGRLRVQRAERDGIAINVYQQRRGSLDAERAAEAAAAALDSFADRFGPYPYNEFDLLLLDAQGDAGIEYPALVIILVGETLSERTEFVIAHETAHQYWYGIVGNDIYNDPWLDEALAHYSAVLATEDRGQTQGEQAYRREVQRLAQRCEEYGDPPAGRAITEYEDFGSYVCAVYGRGAVFLHTLRREIGADAFERGLRAYFEQQRYRIAEPNDFQEALERAAGRSLEQLFSTWLGE